MANLVTHFEIYVDDVERAKKFYADVFGWAFKQLGKEMNDYVLVYPGGEVSDGPASVGINGGMMLRSAPAPSDDKAAPNAFCCTIAVDDIMAIMESAQNNGARVDMPVMDVPGIGKLAYIRDTEMNLVGIIEPPAEMR